MKDLQYFTCQESLWPVDDFAGGGTHGERPGLLLRARAVAPLRRRLLEPNAAEFLSFTSDATLLWKKKWENFVF